MPRYRLTVEYDGTNFAGWQRQNGQMSVQQALEEAIEQFCRHPVRCLAAGRTDAGVHARGQVVHVDFENEWDADKIREAANGILRERSHAAAVLECSPAAADFDARFSARKRHYRYRVIDRRAPLTLDRGHAWHVRNRLDEDAMAKAAALLVGRYDFTTFRASECQAKSPVRTLDVLDVRREAPDDVAIVAVSRSFLHSQVRSMVGSLKLVGEGKWSPEDLQSALAARDRSRCGPIAPACGLYLMQVDY